MGERPEDPRAPIHDAIQTVGPEPENPGRAALLTKWVLVAEWAVEDGDCWLSRISSADLRSWEREGMLHNALNTDWSSKDE